MTPPACSGSAALTCECERTGSRLCGAVIIILIIIIIIINIIIIIIVVVIITDRQGDLAALGVTGR
jgi:hypothetical protein